MLEQFFFTAGKYVNKYPYLLSEIKKRGHLIGNHTYNHPNRRIITFSEYMNELGSCQNIMSKITGEKPKYFRPPKGLISLKGLLTAKKLELKTVLWSIQGGEWGPHKHDDAKTIASRLLRNVRSGDIILLHDNINPAIN